MTKLGFSALCTAMFLLPLTSFAATKTEKNVTLNDSTEIASTQLKPGTYKMEWNGTGSDVQVNFLQHHKVVATAPAKVTDEASGYSSAVEVHKAANGVDRLDEVDFKNIVVNFRGSAANASGA